METVNKVMDNSINGRAEYSLDRENGFINEKTTLKMAMTNDIRTSSGSGDLQNLWDSLDSDTESLAQEKAYQKELEKRIVNEARDQTPYSFYVGIESNQYEDGYYFYKRSESERLPVSETQPTVTGSHGRPRKRTEPPRSKSLEDEYADLRYDPDWRRKLADAQVPCPIQKDLGVDFSSEFADSLEHGEDEAATRKLEYKVVGPPALEKIDVSHPGSPSSSFHLHSPEDSVSLAVSLAPQSLLTSSESTPRLNSDRNVNVEDENIDKSVAKAPCQRQQKERDRRNERKDENRDGDAAAVWEKNKVKLRSKKKHAEKAKGTRPSKDIVEHNKGTLGRTIQKPKSYLRVYMERAEKLDANQLPRPVDNTASKESPDKAIDPELMWIQKTQNLKIHDEDKCSGGPSPPLHRSKPGEHLNLLMESRKPEIAYPPGNGHHHLEKNYYLETGQEMRCPLIFKEAKVFNKNNERIAQVMPSYEDATFNAPWVLVGPDGIDIPDTVLGSAYIVLPPIGRANSSEPEISNDQEDPAPNTLQRCISDGYLADFENGLNAHTTYKPYTLKDYKRLNQEVNLGGLGPSSVVTENMVEKIRRQKLYSDVIREQNKKLSKIPSLSPRVPVVGNNKDVVPRNRALEYAKTIVKPKVLKERSKKKSESEKSYEHSTYLHTGMDLPQLAALEMLRKRHEQEKRTVACFKNYYSSSSTLST